MKIIFSAMISLLLISCASTDKDGSKTRKVASEESSYAFLGSVFSDVKSCESSDSPKVDFSNGTFALEDSDGILAFAVTYNSKRIDNGKVQANVQIAKFGSDRFLGGVAKPYDGQDLKELLLNYVNKKSWPTKTNTKISINFDSTDAKLEKIAIIDGCGMVSVTYL